MLRLIDALTLMDNVDRNGNPVPFQIKFYTKDGELITIDHGVKCIGKGKDGQVILAKGIEPKEKKNPNHFKNATRNIYIPVSGQIRKCKIRLITEFNHTKVVY